MTSEKKFDEWRAETDPRYIAVDAYTSQHLLAPSRNKSHAALEHALHNSAASGLEDIACYSGQGKFLAIQARIAGAQNILEVGTLGGYSAIWMATAGPDVRITTIDNDPRSKEIAEENFAYAGLNDRIQVLLGSGIEVLSKLRDEVGMGTREKFDFVFIDADKQNSLPYVRLALEMTKQRTCIYVDNVVNQGKVADQSKQDTYNAGNRALIEGIGEDDRVEAVVLQTVSEKDYDGFLMAVVK
jgi:predicted O-methyltransferase YrrM